MSLNRDIDLLRQSPLLAGFSSEQLRLLAFGAENVMLREGRVLFHENQLADSAYVIATGQIKLDRETQGEKVDLGSYGTGCMLGETALLVETRRPARALAHTASEVIKVRRSLFRRMLQEYPDMAQVLHRHMVQRFTKTAHDLSHIGDQLGRIQPDFDVDIDKFIRK